MWSGQFLTRLTQHKPPVEYGGMISVLRECDADKFLPSSASAAHNFNLLQRRAPWTTAGCSYVILFTSSLWSLITVNWRKLLIMKNTSWPCGNTVRKIPSEKQKQRGSWGIKTLRWITAPANMGPDFNGGLVLFWTLSFSASGADHRPLCWPLPTVY